MIQLRLIFGGALLFAAIAVIAVVSFFGSREAYYTVDELTAHAPGRSGPAPAGQPDAAPRVPFDAARSVVVSGDIDRATVARGADGLSLRFTLAGKDARLPVAYAGLVPDTFDLASQITVGGRLAPDGTFQADRLWVQCPSKYEAVPPGAALPDGPAGG
jgi:cytochrome c-type biogenesis protein CcmE